MKIRAIKAAGFRGIKGQIEITFPDGFAVITGSNGAGKSTICDAIEYAVCGALSRTNPAKESGEGIIDYLWWRGKERPSNRFVSLELQKDDGTTLQIERGPQGLRGITERQLIDSLCAEATRPADGLNYLIRTAVLRGDQIAELSLDLAETDRFNFVKACVGARDFSQMETAALSLSKAFKHKVERLEADYERGRFRITDVTSRISSTKAQALKAEELLEAESHLRRVLNQPTGDVGDLIRLGRSHAAALKAQVDALLNRGRQLAAVEQRIAEASTPEFMSRLESLEQAIIQVGEKRSQFQAQAQTLEERINDTSTGASDIADWTALHQHGSILGLQNGKCPLCAVEVRAGDFEASLNAIRNRIDLQNKASAELVRQRSKTSENLRRVGAEFDSLQRQYKDLAALTNSLKSEHEVLSRSLRSAGLSDSIPGNQFAAAALDCANQVRDQLTILERHLSVLETSKALERVAEFEKELARLQIDSEALAKLISKAKSTEERFKEAAATIKRVSGELVDERLAELSPLLTELYSRLKPHVDWPSVSYITRGDVRRFLSLRIGDDLNPRFMFSSGQRRAAGLAFLLSVHLSRSWCNLNSLILDDPVQHIDDFRALHLVEVLSAIRQTGRQVICTVEDPELAKLLCRRLRSLTKQEGALISLGYQPERGVMVEDQKPIMPLPKVAILAA